MKVPDFMKPKSLRRELEGVTSLSEIDVTRDVVEFEFE